MIVPPDADDVVFRPTLKSGKRQDEGQPAIDEIAEPRAIGLTRPNTPARFTNLHERAISDS
jgi:hypothetical protein